MVIWARAGSEVLSVTGFRAFGVSGFDLIQV